MALLSIVLPSYNEEQNIAHTARVLSELLAQEQIEYELVFVSDGSRDGTYREIQKAAQHDPHVTGTSGIFRSRGILERKPAFSRDYSWRRAMPSSSWTVICSILPR